MLNKPQLFRRLLALCGLLLLCSSVALSQLFQLQLLNGESMSAARRSFSPPRLRFPQPAVRSSTATADRSSPTTPAFRSCSSTRPSGTATTKRFDTLLDLTHRIQTAAVDATAKQENAAKTAAATDTSSDTSADATDSTDTSSDTPTDLPRRRFLRTRRRFRPSTTGCRSRSPRRSPTTAHR